MNNQTYYVYNPIELNEKLDSITLTNYEVLNFFKNFTFEQISNQQIDKGNTSTVFNKIIKEDTTKAKIIGYLNKLNQHNFTKILNSIREIVFQTTDELNELVYQCIQKIKRDNDLIRPLVAALCKELLSLYFPTADDNKIYFRKLLLTEVKKEYVSSISFNSNEWTFKFWHINYLAHFKIPSIFNSSIIISAPSNLHFLINNSSNSRS